MACWTRILVASRTRSWPCTTRETVAVETPARRATSKRVTTLSRSQALLGPQIPGPSADIQASHKRHVNVYTGNLSAYTNPQHRAGQGPCPRRNKGEVDDGTGGGRRRRTGLPGRVHLGSVNGRLPDRGSGGRRRRRGRRGGFPRGSESAPLPERGRGARRRPGPLGVGHLQPHARKGPR